MRMILPAVLPRFRRPRAIPDGRADESAHRTGGTRFEGMRLEPAEA